MRVIFVGIPHHYLYSKISKSFGKTPPINLAMLAAYLLSKGFDVKIFDPAVDDTKLEEIHTYLPKDFDVIGVSSFSPTIKESVKILEIAKKINPRCIAVMGGSHLTALPNRTMEEFSVIDYGIVGEGEITLFELLETLKQKDDVSKVKGVVYRDNSIIKFTGQRDRIRDLDSLPFPAYHLLPMDRYKLKLHHFWSQGDIEFSPYTNLFTSRGCYYNCNFCGISTLWGNVMCFKSAEYILNEIELLVKNYNVKCIEISDSCILTDKQRLHKILDGLIERDYNLNFTCMLRVDGVDEETLRKLKKAKFRLLRFGVESGCQRILDAMNKRYRVSQIKETFRLVHKVGIAASACIIIGYPGETKETFEETLKLLDEIKPTAVDFYIALPLVGSELYKIALKNGYISNKNWYDWTFLPNEPVLNTPYLSSRDLKLLLKKAYIRFYFNPSFILKCIMDIYFFKKIKFYFSGFNTLISILLKQK